MTVSTRRDPEGTPPNLSYIFSRFSFIRCFTRAPGCRFFFKSVSTSPWKLPFRLRGQIVNQSALLRDLQTRVAVLVEQVECLADLVIQFDGTPEGLLFVAAWNGARVIVAAGHGPSARLRIPSAQVQGVSGRV